MSEQLDMFGGGGVVLHPDAYAAFPGTGPDGETCRSCGFYRRLNYHGKTYRKCRLVESTHGAGTDIKASSPACHRFEARIVEEVTA